MLLDGQNGAFAYRPAVITPSPSGSIVLAGNAAWIGRDPHNGESEFGHITWTTWTATHATGRAVLWADNCKPNCSAGTYFPTPTTLVASRVVQDRYTRLVLRFVAGPNTTLRLSHPQSGPTGYVWD